MPMDNYWFAGDCAHIAALILLLQLVFVQKNAKGVSVRAQELFLVVFLTRYPLDLFGFFYCVYDSCPVITLLAWRFIIFPMTCALVYKIQHMGMDGGYDKARDVFPHITRLVLPCFPLTAIILYIMVPDRYWDFLGGMRIFSIILESVAIVPQLALLQKYREVPPTLAKAILCMGIYRLLDIFNWVYLHDDHGHWLLYSAGVVQSLLYADFFYSYWLKCQATTTVPGTTTNMTYKSVLLNKVWGCDHSAKEEDQSPDDNTSDSASNNSEGVRPPHQGSAVSPPPPLIFSRWTVVLGLGLCLCPIFLDLLPKLYAVFLDLTYHDFIILFLSIALVVLLRVTTKMAFTNSPDGAETELEELNRQIETESSLNEPLLPDEEEPTAETEVGDRINAIG